MNNQQAREIINEHHYGNHFYDSQLLRRLESIILNDDLDQLVRIDALKRHDEIMGAAPAGIVYDSEELATAVATFREARL